MMICFYLTLIVYASINNLQPGEGETLIHFIIAWHLAAAGLLLIKPVFQRITKSPIGILFTLALLIGLATAFLEDLGGGVARIANWFQEALGYFSALV